MLTRMRQTVMALVALVMLIGVLMPHGAVAAPTPMTTNSHSINAIYICATSPIPPGWVITAIVPRVGTCNDFNKFRIEPYVGQSMYICANSPLPPGVVITAIVPRVGTCNDFNKFRIQPA